MVNGQIFSPELPICFISTHYDDVVLSCTNFLEEQSGATVLTVLGGAPTKQTDDVNTRYTGKTYAPDAINIRRAEDKTALDLLDANQVILDFWDNIYLVGRSQDEEVIASQLVTTIHKLQPKSIAVPLGIRHPDHIAVANACLLAASKLMVQCYVYLDLPYGLAFPEMVTARMNELTSNGVQLEELLPIKPTKMLKDRAFQLYHSQYKPTRDDFNYNHESSYDRTLRSSEHYWHLKK